MFNKNYILRQGLLGAAISLAAAAYAAPVMASSDPVILTFSTVGDSRQDNAAPDSTTVNPAQVGVGSCPSTASTTGLVANPGLTGQDCKWLQNSKAFARILQNIQAQKANLLFFNGDMIMGYGLADIPVSRASSVSIAAPTAANPTPVDSEAAQSLTVSNTTSINNIITSDLLQIYQQYSFWRGMVAPTIETGTYIVPVPGNHETQCKRCGKKSQWQNENAWRDNMGDLVIDETRLNKALAPTGLTLNTSTWNPANTPGAADGLVTPQNQLSYSFDVGTSHFAIINTDPAGNDGHAPYNWLDADLTAAVANGANNLFVFGHKPAFYYSYAGAAPSSSSSLYLTNAAAGTAFWNVITKHNATYFSGHEHIYNVSQPINNTTSTGGTAYQVIVGAGGSPFDDLSSYTAGDTTYPYSSTVFPLGTLATDRMYAWGTVSIHQSGKAVLTTYGFDATMTNPVKTLGTFTLPSAQ